VGAVTEQGDGATRAEDPGRSEAKEAAEAVPTESEVAGPVGGYTFLFISSTLFLQTQPDIPKGYRAFCILMVL
jgi:hypothetical protein